MTVTTATSSKLGIYGWFISVSAVIFGVLNVIDLAQYLSDSDFKFEYVTYSGISTAVFFFNLLAPLNFLAIVLLVFFRKPKFAFIPTAILALGTIVFYVNIKTSLFAEFDWSLILPVVSLVSRGVDWPWVNPGAWLLGLQPLLLVLFFILLNFCPKSQSKNKNLHTYKGETNMANSAFCSKCGSPAGQGDFCSKCGNSLVSNAGQPVQQSFVPQPAGTSARTSPMAIAALIVSFFISWIGLILGYIAKKEIRDSNGMLGGAGLAQAAIVIGWIWTVLGFIIGLFWAIALINAGAYGY